MKTQKVKLGDVIELKDNLREPISSLERENRQGPYPYYGAQGIIDHLDDYTFDGNYLLVAEDGENLKSRKEPIANVASGRFRVNNHAHIIAESKECSLVYLRHLLNMRDISSYVTGSTQPKLSQRNLLSIEIDLPSIETQHKIATILSSLDAKIELNAKLNGLLEEMARGIVENKITEIHDETFCIGDYISPKRGKGLLAKNAVPGGVPVVAGGLRPSTYHNVSNTVPPVLTISASGANAGYVSLWNIPVWSSDSSFIDSLMTENVYFWYIVLTEKQKQIYDAQTGSAQPHIYPQQINDLPIGKLDKEKVELVNKEISPLFRLIGINDKESRHLANLRDTLLPKLMSGEVEV